MVNGVEEINTRSPRHRRDSPHRIGERLYLTWRTEKSRQAKHLAKGERTYSGEGEDRILALLFLDEPGPGFYVDVGAHHPMRFSNTYLFYRRGWRGINIDATPGSMQPFNRYRPGDVNIETGIGPAGTMPFYMFDEPAVNSFDKALSESRAEQFKLARVVDVPVRPLREVLADYLPADAVPSFLSVDVEGRDLEVLQTNDWSIFRPTYVLAEAIDTDIADVIANPITELMTSVGYRFIAKTVNTAFYQLVP